MGIIRIKNKEKIKKEILVWKITSLIYLIVGLIFVSIGLTNFTNIQNLYFRIGILFLLLSIIVFIDYRYWCLKLSIIEIVGEATGKENK